MDVLGTCPICFEELKDRETASPDVCDHAFCLSCLQKWAKQGSFCPVDRKRFRKIIDLSTSASIQVKPRKRKKRKTLYDISVHCEVCLKTNGADTLLLCDCCDLGYHCKCLSPPLSKIPAGVWNCPVCVAVSEKIRAKKGLTKELELIVHEHTNWKDSSSDSCSINSSSGETTNVRSNLSRSLRSNQPRSSKRINLGNNKFTESITSNDKEVTDAERRKSRRNVKNTNNVSKLRSLRPRQPSGQRAFFYRDVDASSSEGDTLNGCQRESCMLRKSDKSVCSPMDLTFTSVEFQQSKPLDLTRRENDSFVVKTVGAVCTARKALPEATVTSCTVAKNALPESSETSCTAAPSPVHDNINNDSEFTGICFIESTTSLRYSPSFIESAANSFEEESAKTVDPTQPGLPAKDLGDYKNEKIELPKMSASVRNQQIVELTSEPEIALDKENIGKLLPTKLHCETEIVIEEPSPEIEIFSSNDKSDTPENSDAYSCKLSEKAKPVFSVFEKLDDEYSSQKKYSNINQAVDEIRHKFKYHVTNKHARKSLSPDILKQLTASCKSVHRCDSAHGAKSLSEELREIEKEKWKTYHLRSQKNRKLSFRLQCCNMHSKYNSSDTVHIGRHFRHKKHSENFSKLLSVVKPMWIKEKWDKQDTVIFKSFRNGNCKPNYKPYIHNLNPVDNSASSCEQSSKVCKINSYQNHEIISIESKNLLQLKETENSLLGSVLCLPNVKNLALQEDGSLFVNWQTCPS